MALSKPISFIRSGWHWCFNKTISPALRGVAGMLWRWSSPNTDASDATDQWKQKALDDFSSWLVTLPEVDPDGEPGPQACDLYTVLTEFAALRQEVKLQTRQQHNTLRMQKNMVDHFQNIGEQFNVRLAHLDQLHESLRRSIEESTVLPFLDIRDALVRGETAARAASQVHGFWKRPPKGIEAVAEGYAMALRRFDRSLDRLGIKPIATIGRPFDANTMRAVKKRHMADQDPGIVLEEVAGGFTRASEVLRSAEVVVNSR
jgi:molecular chaperone GrpE (heat shock protein)